MVAMARKDKEEGPADHVPHLPWMRYPVDIDAFSGCPVPQLPRLDPRLKRFLILLLMWWASLSVGSAVGQSSIADEVSNLVRKPKQELYPTIDEEYVKMEPQTKVDILVATPGRLMDHINMTKGFSLEHLQYLVSLLICKSNLKPLSLIVLLQKLQGNKCLVFTSSVESSHRLSTLLGFFEDLPFKFSEYSRLQRESTRRKTLEAFKEGEIDVLIGTDRMARGIHIDGLRYVINYDMPPYVKTYIHRAGRTARAGESGSCFTFLRQHEVKTFEKMLKKADNASCSLHSLPEESIETLRPVFSSGEISS
ncbi:DEAD-box ATP-dependent RNA helicase 1, partial [Dichanthelium oligosanthes]